MPFSEEIIRTVWARAGGICECRGDRHGHGERCGQSLLWSLSPKERLSVPGDGAEDVQKREGSGMAAREAPGRGSEE